MQYSVVVQELYRDNKASHDESALLLIKRLATVVQVVPEVTALHVLSHHVHVVSILESVVQVEDERVDDV